MDDDAILDAIRTYPVEAAEALTAIQLGLGSERRLTAESIAFSAGMLHRDAAELWLQLLVADGHVTAFVSALQARGVAIDEDALADPDGGIPFEELEAFLPRARAFRCRILKNGNVAGSGVLVGPGLVLTAWHVIAVDAPGHPQEPAPNLAVVLSDDSKQKARVPAAYASECGDAEYDNVPPKQDADVLDRNDVALLAMERPAAAHLSYAPLGTQAPVPRSRTPVVLIHYPEGQDRGIDFGRTTKIRNVTSRWRHTVPARSGSSGGACFNKELKLLGIHQGGFDTEKRFVPLERFFDHVLACVKEDIAPTTLWSLDATVEGPLVIGRGLFFEAISSAGEAGSRVRGVRIKRRQIEAGSVGLAFSHDMLAKLLPRRGPAHRIVRVTQDEIVPDLVAEIRRRCQLNGLTLSDPETKAGVARGQAPPETTAKDRAAVLATAVEAVAAADDLTVWFFFDNATVALSEASRLALEGFIDAALVQPHLRLVIAGFETLPLPGLEFGTASPPAGDRSPGLVVEFIGGFRRTDILDFLTVASQDLTGGVDIAAMNHAADLALSGLADFNSFYEDKHLATVSDRLRPSLELLRSQGVQ